MKTSHLKALLIVLLISTTFSPVFAVDVTREMAEELALDAYRESLFDAYDVEVTSVRRENVEHPVDSGNYTDVWYVAVKGKGTEKTSGELVGCTTGYTIIIETGEVISGVSVGAGIAKISYRDVILEGIYKLYPVFLGLGVMILIVIWRDRAAKLY